MKPKHLGLLLLLALPLAACDVRAQDDTAPAQEAAQLSRSVRTVRAERGTLKVTRSASATIEPAQESQVSASTTGQVKAILAPSGSLVEAGQVVIQLEDKALQLQLDNARLALETARINLASGKRSSGSSSAQSSAALQAARTSLDAAQRQYREGQKLLGAGGISQADFAQLKVGLEQAQATLIQAQAAADQSTHAPDLKLLQLQLEQAQMQLEQAQQNLADAQLSAPYAGKIADVMVAEGEFIGAGNPAFRLVSTGQEVAHFSVPPEDARHLLEQGQIWLPYNGLDYAAQVTHTSQAADTRLVEVSAALYPAKTSIPAGTAIQFDYQLELATGVLLPGNALRQSDAQTSVLVVRQGRAEEQPVTLLAEGGAQVAVSGLKAGTQVVYPLPADLLPGTPVEVIGGAS